MDAVCDHLRQVAFTGDAVKGQDDCVCGSVCGHLDGGGGDALTSYRPASTHEGKEPILIDGSSLTMTFHLLHPRRRPDGLTGRSVLQG